MAAVQLSHDIYRRRRRCLAKKRTLRLHYVQPPSKRWAPYRHRAAVRESTASDQTVIHMFICLTKAFVASSLRLATHTSAALHFGRGKVSVLSSSKSFGS